MLNAVIRPITFERLPSLHNERTCLSEEVANGWTGEALSEAILENVVSVVVEARTIALATNGNHAGATHESTTEHAMRFANL